MDCSSAPRLAADISLSCDAVLFDMDGTIVDSTDCVVRVWKWWADYHGLDLNQSFHAFHGRRAEEVVPLIAPHLSAIEEAARLLAREEIDTEGTCAIPGAKEFLNSLPSSSWGLVTSAPPSLARIRMAHAGFSIPEVFVTADRVKEGKPHPEGYLLGAKLLGVDPVRCIVFEDASAGIQAAKAAGMKVIGVLSNAEAHQLDCEICIRDFQAVTVKVDPVTQQLQIRIGVNSAS